MLFDKAIVIMEDGRHVESLVSNTEYSMNVKEHKLYSEGLPVDTDHITSEEILGEWREVYIIETQEDIDKLSEKERSSLVEETFKGVYNKREFDEVHRKKS